MQFERTTPTKSEVPYHLGTFSPQNHSNETYGPFHKKCLTDNTPLDMVYFWRGCGKATTSPLWEFFQNISRTYESTDV